VGEPFNAAGGASGPRASIGVRFVAALIDGILVGIVALIAQALVGRSAGYALGVLVGIGYFAYFEGQPAGQTIGKKAMNIRVIDFATGGSLDSSKALVRSLVRQVSGYACAIGFIWALFNKEKQTWHDLASNTVVVPTSAYPPPA
jgi:uncharacterized RDD family membrane protein YckC